MHHPLILPIGSILSFAIVVIGCIINFIYFKRHSKKAKALERFMARCWLLGIAGIIGLVITCALYNFI